VIPLVSFEGVALKDVLAFLSAHSGVRLTAARSLTEQRVTLYLKETTLAEVTEGLAALLGVEPDAPVVWRREGDGWRLEESANRRAYATRVLEERQAAFPRYVEERVAWARGPGAEEWARNPQGIPRFHLLTALVVARLLDHMGPEGRAALLGGRPLPFRIGELPAELRALCRERVATQSGLSNAPPEELDRYAYVLLFGPDPISPLGDRLWLTAVVPTGVMGSRFSVFSQPNRSLHPTSPGALDFFPRYPNDDSPRVTFTLARDPALAPGQFVWRDLDALLTAIARDADCRLFSDGYLRPRAIVPANRAFRDQPLNSVLTFMGHLWATQHRLVTDGGRRTLFVRARFWPLEDAAALPEAAVRDLAGRLGPDRKATLADLAALAELAPAQVHKLIESGRCPAADGMIRPGWFEEGSSLRPWLRFYRRLPAASRQAVLREGLRLSEAPGALVREHLPVALVAGHGVIDPARWGEIRFRIEAPPEGGVFRFHFHLPGGVQRTSVIRSARPTP